MKRKVTGTNERLEKKFSQKNIDYINNGNIEEEYLGAKKPAIAVIQTKKLWSRKYFSYAHNLKSTFKN